ncbi:UvrD-helicase domain-containing protein [uncultured Hymenobacter sp.]|uniref:UvrD-helicase domain-containing protein n=1 Tax=uncultured Hymenobacter sp. TaxID=170016 RepID=UPI0035CB8E32
MPATFRIYSSSAGSGKTYQLTKEYLKLALGADDPAYFKSILAITFTNDAAGEMKERIIGALRRFARVPAAGEAPDALLAEVAQELTEAGQLSPSSRTEEQRVGEVRRRAAATFRLVLYHYADFAVSTIDSFVQRIVTAFTRELGLPASFEVELDTDSVLQGAVAALLDKVNRDPNSALLSQMLADYALGQAEEGRSWSQLPEELLSFGRALFNETVQDSVAQLGKLSLADFRRLDRALRAARAEIETVFAQAGEAGAALLAEGGVGEADLYQGKSGIWGYVRKGPALLDVDAGPNSYVRATLENDKWYSGKIKSEADKARVDAVKPALTELAATLATLREKYLPNYVLMTAMQPYLFHASLLSELNKLVEQISRERNVVLISEFNRRIASIVLTEPVPFIYERMGDRYNHLLIDEFQDTSVLQWNNLLPLVENTLANNNLSLAVGDAKQSIYRWRGGEMEQILRLYQNNTEALASRGRDPEVRELLRGRYDTLKGKIEPRALNTNFRSAREIIEFNNNFFTQISQRHAELELVEGIFDKNFVQEAPDFGENKGGRAGHVQIILTQADAPARPFSPTLGDYQSGPLPGYLPDALLDYNESTCYLALQLVEQALVDGYGLADVAVLCRTRWQSKLVAKFLKERGFPIISADSLALEFAEVVNLLVAVLRVLHQPAHTLARAEALLLLDKVVRREAPTPARVRQLAALANDAHSAPFYEEFKQQGYDLRPEETGNLGLYELAEQLMQTFGLLGRNGEADYLFRFLDLTLEYSLRFGNNLGNFLAYWDQRKGNISINAPGGRDAITITTVHKAKGLAYGVVIVPFADWTLEPRGGTLLWGHLEEADKPLPGLPDVAVASLSSALQSTALGSQYDEEREKTFLEGLNTLYVALTRPRHRLYIISKKADGRRKADKPGADAAPAGPARTVAELLHGYLQAAGIWDDEAISYVIAQGSPAEKKANGQQLKANSYDLTNLTSAPWEDRLSLRRHANTVFDFDQQEKLGELNRKLHYGLRRLHQATDVGRVGGQLVSEGIISNKERAELEAKLSEVVQHPQLAHFFSAGVGVETEREILVGGVRLRDYKPDRVVFEAEVAAQGGGRAGTRVTLLDFKVPPPQEAHRRQLRQYGELFRQLGYAEVRGLIYYFGTGEVVEA